MNVAPRVGSLSFSLLHSIAFAFAVCACATPAPVVRSVPRVAIFAGPQAETRLTPLSYRGGFEAKTLVFRNLVRRDAEGRIVPDLCEGWEFEDGGRALVLVLCANGRFHDGSPVDARAVEIHLRRALGLPEHDWLALSRSVREVQAVDARRVRLVLDRPCHALADLCAINPCAIQAPSSLDAEGEFVAPIGSGPWAWIGPTGEGGVIRLARFDADVGRAVPEQTLELVRYDGRDGRSPIDDLLAGNVDAVLDGWREMLPRERLPALQSDERIDVTSVSGSSVVYLAFRTDGGRGSDASMRHAVARAIDRAALIADAEDGWADPCTTWAAPSVRIWPRASAQSGPGTQEHEVPAPRAEGALRFPSIAGDSAAERVGEALRSQLARVGIALELAPLSAEDYGNALERGEFDVTLERTWGVPYDPDLSLAQRFSPAVPESSAASAAPRPQHAPLVELVTELQSTVLEERRMEIYRAIQQEIDRSAVVIPLYVPRRVIAVRRGAGALGADHDLYRFDPSGLVAPIAGTR